MTRKKNPTRSDSSKENTITDSTKPGSVPVGTTGSVPVGTTGSVPVGTTGSQHAGSPRITFSDAEVKAISDEVLRSIAEKFNIPVSSLPVSVKNTVADTVKEILNTRAMALIQRDVDSAVKSRMMIGVDTAQQLTARMEAASKGLSVIAYDPNVERVLEDTAILLRKKFDYLMKAGFNEDQAFSLLQSEVISKAGKNR